MDDNEKRELAIGRAAARNDLMIRVRRNITAYAGVAELADALDLGSNTPVCRFKSCRPYRIRTGRHRRPVFFLLCSAGGLSSVKIGKALDISRVLTYNA